MGEKQYFAIVYVAATLSWHPVVQPGYPDARLALFDSVLAAEAAVVDPENVVTTVRVFDIETHEQAVPLPAVSAGADILVDGSWVRPATLSSYV